ncbi:MAG: aminoglycoside phosphotransferase [Haloechinothrix sp.]
MSEVVERTDEEFREWMRGHVARAADHFALTITGESAFGWCLRSISVRASGADGPCWLRVGSEQECWLTDPVLADFWTGNLDANVISGVAKPRVLDSIEWAEPDRKRRVRADLMTFLPGRPCSPTDVLRSEPGLPGAWWDELRRSIDAIRTTSTARFADHSRTGSRTSEVFGIELPVEKWETVHGDLHWNNVFGPDFGLIDWEMWGTGPAGTDAATLHAFGLLVPEIARKVYDVFADVLGTPAGLVAQIHVAARLLHRAPNEFPDLADPLREHIQPVVDQAKSEWVQP